MKAGRHHRFVLGAAALLAAAFAMPAHAQAEDPYLRYAVRPGDTLSQLHRDYLTSPDYRPVQQLNKVMHRAGRAHIANAF